MPKLKWWRFANPIDVVRQLVLVAVEDGRSVGSAAHREVIRHRQVDIRRVYVRHLHPHRNRIGDAAGHAARHGQTRIRQVKRIGDGRTDGVLAADHGGRDRISSPARVVLRMFPSNSGGLLKSATKIAAEDGVLGTLLPISAVTIWFSLFGLGIE